MRAEEFINENKIGKLSKRKSQSTVGLHKFRDENYADRIYELNRIMMAAASTDGTFMPEIDSESWAGRHDVAAPYTQEEANMLKMAYRVVGSAHQDLNNGDLRSLELPGGNTKSLVKPFKGYKRK
jgi:hypothetical protein